MEPEDLRLIKGQNITRIQNLILNRLPIKENPATQAASTKLGRIVIEVNKRGLELPHYDILDKYFFIDNNGGTLFPTIFDKTLKELEQNNFKLATPVAALRFLDTAVLPVVHAPTPIQKPAYKNSQPILIETGSDYLENQIEAIYYSFNHIQAGEPISPVIKPNARSVDELRLTKLAL